MVRQAELVPRPLDQTFSPTSVFPTSRYLVTITKCGPSQRSLPMKLNFRMKYFQYLNFKHYCALLGKSLSYSELQMLWSSPDDQNVYLSVLIPTDNWQGVCWYKWGVGPHQAENRDFCHLLPWKPKPGKNLFENRLIYFLSTIQEEFNYITLRSMKFVILLDETY